MALSSGVCENFTYTSVPPRKSTPRGMPCQNNIENIPATLNTSEKARKYHFLPRKSMLGSLKNSTLSSNPFRDCVRDGHSCPSRPGVARQFLRKLDAYGFAALLAAQNPVKDHARNKNRGKQVGQQT